MVVQNRIAFLRSLVLHGAKLNITVSFNQATCIQKVRVFVDPRTRVDVSLQQCALGVLDMIGTSAQHYRIADKGHRHSDGCSEVLFFIYQGQQTALTTNTLRNLPCIGDDVATLALEALIQRVAKSKARCEELLTKERSHARTDTRFAAECLYPLNLPAEEHDSISSQLKEAQDRVADALKKVQDKLVHLNARLEKQHGQAQFGAQCHSGVLRTVPNCRLSVTDALNSLLNGAYDVVGTHDARPVWQSAQGVILYYSATVRGWHFGYTCIPQRSMAYHPSHVALSPPASDWDDLINEHRDLQIRVRIDSGAPS